VADARVAPRVIGPVALSSRPIACRARRLRVGMPSPGRYSDTTSSAQHNNWSRAAAPDSPMVHRCEHWRYSSAQF